MVKGTVSVDSKTVSLMVGKVTLKVVTPAGTLILPVLSVTPLLKVAVP